MPHRTLSLIDNEQEIKTAGKVFRAIDHPIRKKILKILEKKTEATVTEIYLYLKIDQPVASQHLKILREIKAVEAQRKGKAIVYKLNFNKLTKLEKIISEIITEIVSD